MFLKAPEQREQAIIAHGNYVSMNDDDKRSYENRVVSFFLLRLPVRGRLSARVPFFQANPDARKTFHLDRNEAYLCPR